MSNRVRRQDNTTRVQRWDRVQLPADLAPAERTAQGYLRAHAAVAVPGVMPYVGADGSVVRELIPPEELHKTDSLTTLASNPITLQHPDEDVTPDNVGELAVGDVGPEVQILEETGHVRVGLVLRRRDALDAVDAGMVEVSPGYTCEIDPTSGVHPEYGEYDAIQRNRRYNHLAIVDQARGGPTVKLRADSTDRLAQRRCDAAPTNATVIRRIRTDADPNPEPNPAPRADRGRPMIHLLTIAALLGMSVTTRADGERCVVRNDMELTEEQLVGAIREMIAKLQAEASEETPEGEMSMEDAKAKIADLEGQLADMQSAEETRKADEAARIEAAERKRMDALADTLQVSHSWAKDTPSTQRALDIVKAQRLVPADAVLRSDEAPAGIDPLMLSGMIGVLAAQHKVEPAAESDTRADGTDAYQGLRLPTPTAPRQDKDDHRQDADPFKAAIARRRNQSATT